MSRSHDTPTLLFEFDVPADPQPRLTVVSTWAPPAPAPLAEPVALLLPLDDLPAADPPLTTRVDLPTEIVEPALPADPTVAEGPLPSWASALGVFDLETTGIDTATARIVTAHVGVIDETGTVVERKDWIVNPGVPIPEGAAAIHGVTDERAQRFGRPPGEVVAEILAAIRSVFARGFPLVVYNAPYDLTLLAAEADRHRLYPLELRPLETSALVIDPLVLDKQVERFRRGKRTLTRAAEVYGVDLVNAHDAGADAIAAGRVAQAMARRHSAELSITAHELHDAQINWCEEQSARFQSYMRESNDPDFTCSGAWPSRSPHPAG